MLAIQALSSPLHTRPSLLSSSRQALADSTNVTTRPDVCGPGSICLVYPTSSVRTGCGWSDVESTSGSVSTSFHSRHHPSPSTPSRFPMAHKAPPTVSISFSAASSQNTSGKRSYGSRTQCMEPDLPDVKSVVPFPSSPLDGDMDVEMLDGTCVPCPDGHLPTPSHAPRKRRSAHSSIFSSQCSIGKDAKQKRPRKSKRQVTELWWLGVIHRSILRGIEARQSAGGLDPDKYLSGAHNLDALDRILVERIQKRLAENGCGEGRPPSPLPRISSPSISVPSLNLLTPSRKTVLMDSSLALTPELSSKENTTLDRTATTSPVSKAPPRTSLSIISYSPVPTSTSPSRRRHVRFEITQRPRQPQSPLNIPRRSPSPPARTGTVTANPQTLTLTMSQLVASLTLVHHERSSLRLRGRTCRPPECGENAGRSLPSTPRQILQCDNDAIQVKDRMHQLLKLRARLSSAPERRSPLSCVALMAEH